jgi:hypothetical protein
MIKSRRMRWAGHVAHMEEKRNSYRLFLRKREARRPLGRPKHKLEDNIKVDLEKWGWGDMDKIHLAPDRNVEGPCEIGNEPSCSMKCLEAE